MPRRRLLGTSGVVHVLAVVVLGLTATAATPCAACSCAESGSLADSAANADVVFVGRAVGTNDPAVAVPGVVSSADEVGRIFEVTEVRKGRAAARTEVRTARSGASCGLEVEAGSVYVVVADSTPTGLHGGLCDGTRLLSTVSASDLDAVGDREDPGPGALAADLPVVATHVVDAVRSPMVTGAVVAAVAGLVALVATLVARRRRRGPKPTGDTLR